MYEFVQTEKGWVLVWGAAVLYGAEEEAPKPVVPAVAEKARADAREPLTTLSA
jgi:hypothetical protein